MAQMHNHLFLNAFIERMKSATSGVEFNFNNIMYKQTEGDAMGVPLSLA